MKASDLREKTAEDLAELHKALAHDVFQHRLKNFTNRLDDTSSIRKTKRDLARVLTILRQRAVASAAPVASAAAPAALAEPAPKKNEKKTAAAAAEASAPTPAATKKASGKKGEAKSQ
jgi:large subunit ribosomal protein L29